VQRPADGEQVAEGGVEVLAQCHRALLGELGVDPLEQLLPAIARGFVELGEELLELVA